MNLTSLTFATGALVLAAGPVAWLLHTWADPAFDSPGSWVFAAVVLLSAWSFSSPLIAIDPGARRRARHLFAATAAVRLASHILDVDVLGGFALVIDVYALGLLGSLHLRRRAASPGWLALLFTFALPIERIAQRLIGYPLQWLSARGACTILGLLLPDTHCAGISIEANGHSVLVDLPCSGARGLVALGILFAVFNVVRRPTLPSAMLGTFVAVSSALGANLLRVTLLSLGVAFGTTIPIDVMAAPWHETIGAVALAAGAVPIGEWARRVRSTRNSSAPLIRREAPHGQPRPLLAAAFLSCALTLFVLPHNPVDASAPVSALALPASLLGRPIAVETLDEKEARYFTRYGGAAIKARYGDLAVLAVTTTAPLRHLHAPDECLRGSGHSVRLLRTVLDASLPAAVYRSTTPDGATYRVAATFLSDRGDVATSISEVAWRWLQQEHAVWTSLQRIVPEDTPRETVDAFDAALIAALELPFTRPPPSGSTDDLHHQGGYS